MPRTPKKQPPLVHRGHKPADIGATQQWRARQGEWYVQVILENGQFLAMAFQFSGAALDNDKTQVYYARGDSPEDAQLKLAMIMKWEELAPLEEVYQEE